MVGVSAAGVTVAGWILMPGMSWLQSIARMYLLVKSAARVSIPGRVMVRSGLSDDGGIRLRFPSCWVLTALSFLE